MRTRIIAAVLLASAGASAEPILRGDGAGTVEAQLAARARGVERQQREISRAETVLPLEAMIKPAFLPEVTRYFAQPDGDFLSYTGVHPFETIERYVGHERMAFESGFYAVAAAARLGVLRVGPARETELAQARSAATEAARAWHRLASIGGSAALARGVRRVRAAPGEPEPPGAPPIPVPMKDATGAPLPPIKAPAWRSPAQVADADWLWLDDARREHYVGWALALAWLWDELLDDPSVPESVTDALADDALRIGRALVEVAPETGLDLCLRDADTRLTSARCLNPRAAPDGRVLAPAEPLDGAGAAASLAVMRAIYHVTGDAAIGRFYYEELVSRRDYPSVASKRAGRAFAGPDTDFTDAALLSAALAILGRLETDPAVRAAVDEALANQLWSTGDDRDASHQRQPWYDVVFQGFSRTNTEDLRARVREGLSLFRDAPLLPRDRVNCDDAEIARRECVAIDGTTRLVLDVRRNKRGALVATTLVPIAIRPDTSFEWSDDPYRVNGVAEPRLHTGGDFVAAYWLARSLDLDPARNVSAHARPALPYARRASKPPAAPPANAERFDAGGCATVRAAPADLDGALAILSIASCLRLARRASTSCRGGGGRPRASRGGPSSPRRR
jgi:hypothetical protein